MNSLESKFALGPRSRSSGLGRKELSNSSLCTIPLSWLCPPFPLQLDATSPVSLPAYAAYRGLPHPSAFYLFSACSVFVLITVFILVDLFPTLDCNLWLLLIADTSSALSTVFGQDRCSINVDKLCG